MRVQSPRVLLALDEKQVTSRALEATAEVLAMFRAYELHVVSVLAPDTVPQHSASRERRLEQAQDSLCEAAAGFVKQHRLHPRLVVAHVTVGDAVQELLQAVESLQGQVLLLGSHGKGHDPLDTGHVTAQVIREAPCPVVVLPADPAEEIAAKSSRHIECACPACLEVRRNSGGAALWCSEHTEEQYSDSYFHRDQVQE